MYRVLSFLEDSKQGVVILHNVQFQISCNGKCRTTRRHSALKAMHSLVVHVKFTNIVKCSFAATNPARKRVQLPGMRDTQWPYREDTDSSKGEVSYVHCLAEISLNSFPSRKKSSIE